MKKICILVVICILLMISSLGYTKLKDNEITIYTTQESEDVEELVKDFEEKYPDIKLNIIKAATGEITAKLLLENGNPQADVVWNVATSGLLVLDAVNGLAPYAPPTLDKIDSKYYDTKREVPTWVGTNIWTGVITVNTEEAKKKGLPIPKTYEELANPIFKDEIVMPDPIASGTGYLMVNSWLQSKGEEVGWGFIKKINNNIKFYTTSGSAPAKSTAIGEQVIGLSFDKNSLKIEKDVSQIKTIFAKDGLPYEIDACALVNKKEIKEEAKIFYDWATSEETIEKYKNSRTLITLKGAEPAEGIPNNFKEMLSNNDLYWAAENKNRISLEWNQKIKGSK